MGEMGKVNINETKATTTARDGGTDLKRGELVRTNNKKFIGNMRAEQKKVGSDMGADKVKVSATNANSKHDNNKPAKLKNENARGGSTSKRLALSDGITKTAPNRLKNAGSKEASLDAGMALMASRTASAEYQKPDITKLKEQRKSVSGMLVDVARPVQHGNGGTVAVKNGTDNSAKVEIDKNKEKISKTWSTLIGVGVALVVAVIGFAAIAIFGNNKEKCTVTFESNGGSAVESTEIVCGRTVSQPSGPVKDGFTFDGWIYEGDPFDFSTGIYKNAVIVARWKADENTETVTVKFDSDGGSAVQPIEAAKGKTIKAPNDPKKSGWAFSGWYLNGEKFDFSKPIDGDMTLTANWRWVGTTTGGNSGGNNNNSGSGNNGSSSSGNNNSGNTTGSPSTDKPAIDDQNQNTGSDNPPVSGGSQSGDNQNSGSSSGNQSGSGTGADGSDDGENGGSGTGSDSTGNGGEGGGNITGGPGGNEGESGGSEGSGTDGGVDVGGDGGDGNGSDTGADTDSGTE